jgi:hypothetical protein
MHRAPARIVALLIVIVAAGCAAAPDVVTAPPADAIVKNSIKLKAPAGTESAYIYEIDGEPVSYLKDAHILSPGKHTFRVWPKLGMGEKLVMIPDRVKIARDEITVGSIEIELKPGFHYWLGARSVVGRTTIEAGIDSLVSDPNNYISPVLLKAIEPKTLEEGAKGMSVFFGLLALGPLAAGGF